MKRGSATTQPVSRSAPANLRERRMEAHRRSRQSVGSCFELDRAWAASSANQHHAEAMKSRALGSLVWFVGTGIAVSDAAYQAGASYLEMNHTARLGHDATV